MKGTGIKLAIFTAFTIFVTMALASIIGNISLFGDAYQCKAFFSDAIGVLAGDLVKIAGVNVGKVVSIETRGDNAIVTMQIDTDYQIPKNATV